MQPHPPPYDPRVLDTFVALAGSRLWSARLAEIRDRAASGSRTGRLLRQRYALELAIERLRRGPCRPPLPAELRAAWLAGEATRLSQRLGAPGRRRLRDRLRAGLAGDGTLIPLFHVLRTAVLQASRGFDVTFPGLQNGAPYDLLISRDASCAEVACQVVSADQGRLVAREAWLQLADRLSGDVKTWLSARPGSHLLKMTLPEGLRAGALGATHARIRRLLQRGGHLDDDTACVLRLQPLVLPRNRPREDLLRSLRGEFGPEAHLAVTAADAGIFVMAARAGRLDEVGAAVHRTLQEISRPRLSGSRPGILAIFIEDIDRADWFGLRDSLSLEGEARRFLADQTARNVVAVTCTSRFELFGMPDAADDGELRFRNSAHPAAKAVSLAPAILSSV
jgi:hypothetical protein